MLRFKDFVHAMYEKFSMREPRCEGHQNCRTASDECLSDESGRCMHYPPVPAIHPCAPTQHICHLLNCTPAVVRQSEKDTQLSR